MNWAVAWTAWLALAVGACAPTRLAPSAALSARGPSATASATPTSPAALSPAEQQALDGRLIAAAWANDVREAAALVDRGADVNAKDGTQQSAFLIAASEGHLDLLELTLNHGAEVDAKDRFNGTALIRAAERGHADVCVELIRAGVELDHVNNLGWTALHEAVVLGDGGNRALATVEALVAGGADVTIRSGRFAMTPAEHAEQRGLADMARLLRAAERN